MHQSQENLAALLINDLDRNFEQLVLAYKAVSSSMRSFFSLAVCDDGKEAIIHPTI
jgi:hypothetical protein